MWPVWDTKEDRHLFGATEGQRRRFLSLRPVPWLADEWSSPQTRHCANPSLWRKRYKSCVYPSLPEQQTLGECFKVELRLLTDVDPSHFPLARHTSSQIHKHTQRLTVPLWLPPHTQYTHHNDLARPTPCWSVYLLHSNLPLGFDNSSFMPLWRCRGTTPCLSVHLSVHLSVLPVTQWHEWQIRSWSAARDWVKGVSRSQW